MQDEDCKQTVQNSDSHAAKQCLRILLEVKGYLCVSQRNVKFASLFQAASQFLAFLVRTERVFKFFYRFGNR